VIDKARKLSITMPAGPGAVFSQEAADSLVGQWFHLLINGHARLAVVVSAELWDQGAEVHIVSEVQPTQPEPDPTPLEVDRDGQAYPQVEEA
jgi:hypothetical protein